MILATFWEAKTDKIRKKNVFKNMRFFDFDFFEFFGNFSTFWLDFGKPWALQKLPKIAKNVILIAFICQGAPKSHSLASKTPCGRPKRCSEADSLPSGRPKRSRIQNFCKCTFAAVLTKLSLMESTGRRWNRREDTSIYIYIYIYI